MLQPNVFQLFQPIGGVGARLGLAVTAACTGRAGSPLIKAIPSRAASRRRRMADSICGWGRHSLRWKYTEVKT